MPTSFNRIILLAAISIFLLTDATAQTFSWAQAISGTSGGASGTDVCTGTTDNDGNIYSIGNFGGTADFDAGPGVYNLTAVSSQDMFIMKEDSSGALIWVKQVKGLSSGVGACLGRSVDVDGNGNVYVVGYVTDGFDFDPGPAVYKLGGPSGDISFILKLDSSGNFVWMRSIGYQNGVYPPDVRATAAKGDKNGNLYFAASIKTYIVGIAIPDPNGGFISFYDGDLLLGKIDSNGIFIWIDRIRASAYAKVTPTSLAIDSASNVFVLGSLHYDADFDPGPGNYVLQGGPISMFVAKYNSAGNFSWASIFGVGTNGDAKSIAVDRFGNLLLTGSFSGTIDFDPGTAIYKVTAKGAKDFFIQKLRNNGDFAWVRTVGKASGTYYGGAVTTDAAGNVYSALGMNDSCDLDPGAGSFKVPSGVAVQELDSSGNFRGGVAWQASIPNWIGLDNENNIYVSGIFSGDSSDFDPGPGVFLLFGNRNVSEYITKLKQEAFPNSIMGANRQTEVSVYPNPSSGIITFSSPLAIERIRVTDMAGKLVYFNEPNKAKTVIDLGDKAKGVYFYEVDCVVGKQRGKLVIY